ncbi:hypothetical protein HBO11_04615 [Pseudomonas sp. WS 5010]|jgi:hypothetical protein|uniref:hypothetical protein n=1 Tax=unclassified Pseudomonas TaxID=196821 RepID=UPI0014759309|nr:MULTISPECIES: hypothetical protein [unclassified Pseudomonas]NMX64433.1 hypothetical protein [Pseudomonas sp. WS 5079]NMX84830.1 hypothetical protein [Pseudomonas sp. WS 5010]
MFSHQQLSEFPMIFRRSLLCIALVAIGFIAGYAAKPNDVLQLTAGQLIECGEVTIPTLGM